MNVVEHLRQSRDLIADPARYTRGTLAATHLQEAAMVQAPLAAKWCALGAQCKVAGTSHASHGSMFEKPQLAKGVRILARAIDPEWEQTYADVTEVITDFGDNAPHEDIIAAYDRAIALATSACPED